jgi:hypothetical protein
MHRIASLAGLLALIGLAVPLPAVAQKQLHKSDGVAVTGPNDRCTEPIWTISGMVAGPATHGTLVGIEDPAPSAEPIPLVPDDCQTPSDAGLATFVDGAYFAERGWPDPGEALLNLNLRRVPVEAGNGVRAPIPPAGSVPPNPLPPTIADPAPRITLSSWLEASGRLKIVCKAPGEGQIKITLKKLVPNGLYSVWGVWRDFIASELLTVPFGGFPNVLAANARGKGTYARNLQYCPLNLTPDGSTLMHARVIYHADGSIPGTVPAQPFLTSAVVGYGSSFLSTLPLGIVSFDHVGFRVGADEIE